MKAVILTRVSTKDQEEGFSLNAQYARLESYAKRKNLNIIKTFEIIESSTRGRRKEFMAMIDYCKAQTGTIAIIADAVDRVQRSFKETSMLDELIKAEKIELHFCRENMVIGKNAKSSDIMLWEFSIMGAHSYVLQLSENVKRSIDFKIKNGEFCGAAPTGYENYVNENGKSSIRKKEPEATKIKFLLELYSLGKTSVRALTQQANAMDLRTRTGCKMTNTSMTYIIDNPFYYGEMISKGRLVKHVHPTIISKEIYDRCQLMRKRGANNPVKHGEIPFVYRGMFNCLNSGKTCPNEIKKKRIKNPKGKGFIEKEYFYLVCYTKKGKRMYVPEQDITEQLADILRKIRLPDDFVRTLKLRLKDSKGAEIEFRNKELGRLQSAVTKARNRLKILLDMRLDDELTAQEYEDKRAELQLEIDRTNEKIKAHGKADDSFDKTILELMEIATSAYKRFRKCEDIEQKRLLLRFIFDELAIDEGTIHYKLNFPFSKIEELADGEENSYEPLQSKALSGISDDFEKGEKKPLRTENNDLKTIRYTEKSQGCSNWLGRLDSNQRMSAPKADALPLGDTPTKNCPYGF